jgi:hypothetical protein
MLFRENIPVYCEKRMKHRDLFCRRNAEFNMVKQVDFKGLILLIWSHEVNMPTNGEQEFPILLIFEEISSLQTDIIRLSLRYKCEFVVLRMLRKHYVANVGSAGENKQDVERAHTKVLRTSIWAALVGQATWRRLIIVCHAIFVILLQAENNIWDVFSAVPRVNRERILQ